MPRKCKLMSLERQICIYCGEQRSTPKGDHTFPSGLVRKDRRGTDLNAIQVPCCCACQEIWKNDEKLFINQMSWVDTSDHPEADATRDRAGTNIEIGHDGHFVRSLDITDARPDGSGIRIPTHPSGTFVPTLTKIARGLYWHHCNVPLPASCDVGIDFNLTSPEFDSYHHAMSQIGIQGPYRALRDAIVYEFSTHEEVDRFTSWLITIYNGNRFFLRTVPQRKIGDMLVGVASHPRSKYVLVERNERLATLLEVKDPSSLSPSSSPPLVLPANALGLFDVVDHTAVE